MPTVEIDNRIILSKDNSLTDSKKMSLLEGDMLLAYDDTLGNRTVGKGFNMDDINALKVWNKLDIQEDFDQVYYKQIEISQDTSDKLFLHLWNGWCIRTVVSKCEEEGVSFNDASPLQIFVWKDIAYNTGSLRKWHKVFHQEEPLITILESRRKPHKYLDSRVCKIGMFYGIFDSIEDAIGAGLEYA